MKNTQPLKSVKSKKSAKKSIFGDKVPSLKSRKTQNLNYLSDPTVHPFTTNINIYPIPKAQNDEDENIAELREQKKKEENKRLEEEKQLALAKKKREEQKWKLRAQLGKEYSLGNYNSYDISGKFIDVQLINKFEELVPKVKKGIYDPIEEPEDPELKKTKQGVPKQTIVKKKNTQSLSDLLMETVQQKEKTKYRENVVYPRVNEHIVPAIGVKFAEHGKKIKENNMSIEDIEGKMSKAKLQSISFLPDINKPYQSIFLISI